MEIQDGSAKFSVRDKRMQAMVDMFYPVGTVYATTATEKPEFMNYGTWEQFAQGRTLVGAGTADSGTVYTVGSTGGEEKHKLTVNELASHSHGIDHPRHGNELGGQLKNNFAFLDEWDSKFEHYFSTSNCGGDQPHNNMQPYSVVYIFRRIA